MSRLPVARYRLHPVPPFRAWLPQGAPVSRPSPACPALLRRLLLLVAAATLGVSCAPAGDSAEAALEPALAEIREDQLLARIETLSSDAYGGRAPGTAGEDSSVAFLTREFQALGLAPGNPDGSWVQNVTMVGWRGQPTATFRVGNQTIRPTFPEQYVAMTRRNDPRVTVNNSEIVFVGYGVVAPEYGWDDYKDVDVRGKTIVMLVNDPAVADSADPARLDSTMFRGAAMTYYGRWTYKYEIATEKGAAAAIIIHETGPAGYPWEVVSGSWGARENIDVRSADGNAGRVAVESWIHSDVANSLFTGAGLDLDSLKALARTRDFRPVPLGGATASFNITNTFRDIESRNVVAKLEGSDPALRDEYVIYTAHWDHLGTADEGEGDRIFNGALDNATGTAGLVQLAQAFTALETPPARSILFLAVTAEESGLLGAKYYAENPLYPLEKTVANINMDGLNQWGPTNDIVVVGLGNSTLDDVLAEAAEPLGRVLVADPEPEKGFFYRSDHFEFAKKGVPALYTDAGTEFVGKPEGYGTTKREEYTADDYHKPSDEVKPDWDLSGAVQDLGLLLSVGYRVANAAEWPTWKPGTEFKSIREAMLSAGGGGTSQ